MWYSQYVDTTIANYYDTIKFRFCLFTNQEIQLANSRLR